MEHEVFVPVPAEQVRVALADPARVARALPGLQQDVGTPPVAGRLKVRVGGHTITYRGTLRVSPRDDGTYAVEGDATEARGTGAVKLALTLELRPTGDGTTLRFEGSAAADGRIAHLPADAVEAAAVRLLHRCAELLGAAAGGDDGSGVGESGVADAGVAPSGPEAGTDPECESGSEAAPGSEAAGADPESEAEADPESGAASAADPRSEAEGDPRSDTASGRDPGSVSGEDLGEPDDETPAAAPPPASVEAEISPPGDVEPVAVEPGFDDLDQADDAPVPTDSGPPPAEAAHARRTMIGRSAEEVDHSPPRGRYAPVPAPQTAARDNALRWAAPAAALAVASAIVVGRALRRRH